MITLRVNMATDSVAAKLIEAVAAVPMGLVAHVNGQANAAKRGITVPADQILEVFRPDFAIRVWKAHKPAGIEIPLRIYLYEADGATQVAYRTAKEVFAPYANPELDAIAADVDPIFEAILATLSPEEN
ncbi:DUF302 domain-containing protein [Parasulfuritortus cantonensis]|uniref:DUF302 domain-containing protein n=1 Tax=Parasulfuritortus cantonensis TaxID=2528202 RepID=A0A4R1B6N7_9PROT|nr:DUF302 domain-containing protein [Parasulfuritortus cantonensis]TCJ11645.1 DUF302 domain-containing protein [Parasulfuritortus cantonensis]